MMQMFACFCHMNFNINDSFKKTSLMISDRKPSSIFKSASHHNADYPRYKFFYKYKYEY